MGKSPYRVWIDSHSNPRVQEAAAIAEIGLFYAAGVFHAICESAWEMDVRGVFSTTPRRLAAVSREPVDRMEAIFAAFGEVGLIRDGVVVDWERRRPSRRPATRRKRK